jgi:hypothetical protein
MVLGYTYEQSGSREDAALGARWLEQAARGGNPIANMATGRVLMANGSPAEGAARLRSALDKLPNGEAALWLYLARVHSKQTALARTELAAHFAHHEDKAWPAPVADFYLGRITAEALLTQAGGDSRLAKKRTCDALSAMSEWHGAHGESAQAAALTARHAAQCRAP